MLDYYVEQCWLPFKATNWLGEVIGFIFAQVGGYDTDDLERVGGIEEMWRIARLQFIGVTPEEVA